MTVGRDSKNENAGRRPRLRKRGKHLKLSDPSLYITPPARISHQTVRHQQVVRRIHRDLTRERDLVGQGQAAHVGSTRHGTSAARSIGNGMLRVDDLIAELCLLPARVLRKRKRKEFQTVELLVRMDCEGCERRVKKALEDMKGAFSVRRPSIRAEPSRATTK